MQVCDPTQNVETRISSERIGLTIPTRLEWIDQTVAFLGQKAASVSSRHEPCVQKVALSLHEALTNAIVHGNLEISSDLKEGDGSLFAEMLATRTTDEQFASRTVEITSDRNHERFEWSITDEGPGFDVDTITARGEANEPSTLASGRGLILMKAFMDDVRYELGGRRVVMTLGNDGLSNTPNRPSSDLVVSSPNDAPATPVGSDSGPCHDLPDWDLDSLLESEDHGAENRNHQRFAYTKRITVREPSNEEHVAFARDISKGGICFICNFPIGSHTIEMTLPRSGAPLRVTAEIVRCTQITSNVFDIGARFLQMP